MGKKKTTRPAIQAVTPAYITVAEQLAHETCARLKTTPPKAAKKLGKTIAIYGGYTDLSRTTALDDLFSDPINVIQETRGGNDITEEHLAAVLWLGVQIAKALTRQSNGNAAALADLSWHLSRIATALRFPKLRTRILNEGRDKSAKTRQQYAAAWRQIAETTATDYLRQHPKDKLIAAIGVCRQKIIAHLGRAPKSSSIERHLKRKKIFSSTHK